MKLLWNWGLATLGVLVPTAGLAQPPAPTAELQIVSGLSNITLEKLSSEAGSIYAQEPIIPASSPVPAELALEADEASSNTDSDEEAAASDPDDAEASEEAKPSPEEIARRQKLVQADRLYLEGDVAAAQQLYREAKEPFAAEQQDLEVRPEPIYEPANLPPSGTVYWREYQSGLNQELESKVLAPLKLLVERHPEFIPGHITYSQALEEYEREEEALNVLQAAIALYPSEPQLLRAKIEADAEAKHWLEASLSARQFALFNPSHPQAAEFEQLADDYLERYKGALREDLTLSAIGNVVTGALGYALTGNLFGPLSAIETTALLLQGESGIGNRYANRLQEQLPLVEDEEVLAYVRGIGQELATAAGRDEFEYEFYVVLDDRLNAFALPGGKVFVHTGAIQKTESEAELAGLLAHELSHAVLSHGFQLVTQGNLTANVAQFVPYGGTAANLLVLNYSRSMEREADVLGTRILSASGYAADGVRNLMETLAEEDTSAPFVWLSTHPDTKERVRYLEEFIVSNDYNRYAYEGVSKHSQIKERVDKLWKDYQESEEYQERE